MNSSKTETSASPGRPREFDIDEATLKIMNLFWENGYEATGLSYIIRETELAKASLYAAYGNKKQMYLKALAHYESLAVDGAVAVLRDPKHSPLDRIKTFLSFPIDAVKDQNDRRGCFLCNASADRAWEDDDIAQVVRNGYEKMRRAIIHSLTEATPDAAPETINSNAQLVLTVYSGLRVMARSRTDVSLLVDARDACMKAVGG